MLLYEALFNEESMDYFEAQKHLYPLVWDVKMALKAISECDIQELQGILNIAEKFYSNTKYDEKYEAMEEKLQKIWNFIKNFYKHFSETVDKSILKAPEKMASAIAGNIINLIAQDDQLGLEEIAAILHSLKPIVGRLSTDTDRLMSNIYFAGLDACEKHNAFGKQFAIIISSRDNWSIDQFIRGYSTRLDKIIYNGLSSILCSKAEIRRLDNSSKKDIKLAYKALVKKKYRFSLVERYRALFL
jgi:hypothetical protein